MASKSGVDDRGIIIAAVIGFFGAILAAVITGVFVLISTNNTARNPPTEQPRVQPTQIITNDPTATPYINQVDNPKNQPPTQRAVIQPPEYPTDTPVPDTQPNSILEVGQSWRERGLSLLLQRAEVHLGVGLELGPNALLVFTLTNNRSNDILVKYSGENFSAVDNLGNRLKVLASNETYGPIHPYPPKTIVVKPGQMYYVTADPNVNGYEDDLCIQFNVTNPQIRELVIAVSNLSSINNARWRVPNIEQ